MTWLEKLVQEFYKAQGYWVVTNVRYGPLGHGGYVGEADLLAFGPHSRTLVHVECTRGSEAMARRREVFRDKFEKAEAWYQGMLPVPFDRVDKVAIPGWSTRLRFTIEGVECLGIGQFLPRIVEFVTETYTGSKWPPEQYPILRAIYVCPDLDRRRKRMKWRGNKEEARGPRKPAGAKIKEMPVR